MSESGRTTIRFTYDGHWKSKDDGSYEWLSENNKRLLCVSIRKAECNITYNDVAKSLCRKIGVDQASVSLRMSYLPVGLFGDMGPTYISAEDDEDVLCYLDDKVGSRRGLLYVEIDRKADDDETADVEAQNEAQNDAHDDAIPADDYFGVQIATEANPFVESVGDHCEPFVPCDVYGDVLGDVQGDVQGEQSGDFSFNDGLNFEIGQEFAEKEEVSALISKASMKACFKYRVMKSSTTLLEVKCAAFELGCKWVLRVAKLKNSDWFSVRTYKSVHTCSAADNENRNRTCTAELVSNEIRRLYPQDIDTPTPQKIVEMMNRDYGVSVSYYKAWRAKREAATSVRGSSDVCYSRLPSYLHMLKSCNPGTVTHLEVDEEQRFKYMFIALGACIEGFKALRKVIAVDGTFLKTGYKGTLIVATAQDGNFHQYPLAWGVVDSENDASWTWFFTKLVELIPDDESLVIISDRHQSIIKSVGIVYQKAYHGYCAWHISQNVKSHVSKGFRGKGKHKVSVVDQFMKMAGAYTVSEFNTLYDDFKNRYESAANYIEESVPVQKWARCYFPGHRYNMLTTNGAESINAVLKKAREYPLLPLIDAIVEKVSEWFNKHRNESASGTSSQHLTPAIEKLLYSRLLESSLGFEVKELNSRFEEYWVKENGKTFIVGLEGKTCTCKRFDIDQIPCAHAMAAAGHGNSEHLRRYCSVYYLKELWSLAYTGTIYPVPHEGEWDVPQAIQEILVLPPVIKRRRGRHQQNRFPSAGEPRGKKKTTKSQQTVDNLSIT